MRLGVPQRGGEPQRTSQSSPERGSDKGGWNSGDFPDRGCEGTRAERDDPNFRMLWEIKEKSFLLNKNSAHFVLFIICCKKIHQREFLPPQGEVSSNDNHVREITPLRLGGLIWV